MTNFIGESAKRTKQKGQLIFIDVVVLGVCITILLAFSFSLSNQPIASQIAREEAFYANTMILSAMSWINDTYAGFNNSLTKMNIAEAVNIYFCSDIITRSDVEFPISYILNKTVKPDMNYIFFAEGNNKTLWLWNKQPDVCAKSITVVTLDFKPVCIIANWTAPMLGVWPNWKKLPPKSQCAAGIVK